MAFSFGFSGDDIDIDDWEVEQPVHVNSISAPENDLPEPVAAKRHEMGEWVGLFLKFLIEHNSLMMPIDPHSPIANIIQQAPTQYGQ